MNDDRIADIFIAIAIVLVIILKFCGVITCSWLVLLSPIIVLLAIGTILALIFLIAALFYIYHNK